MQFIESCRTPNFSRNVLTLKEISALPKRGNELFLFQVGAMGFELSKDRLFEADTTLAHFGPPARIQLGRSDPASNVVRSLRWCAPVQALASIYVMTRRLEGLTEPCR